MKLITELNIGDYETGGGSDPGGDDTPGEAADLGWPNLTDFSTLGNTITFADNEWTVMHKTDTEVYLGMNSTYGYAVEQVRVPEDVIIIMQDFIGNVLNGSEKLCLKNVSDGLSVNVSNSYAKDVTFMLSVPALTEQLDWCIGDNLNETACQHRDIGADYWTSTIDGASRHHNYISSGGYIANASLYDEANFRPFVCVDLTTYDAFADHPNISDLTVGNTIYFGYDSTHIYKWAVVRRDATECHLILMTDSGISCSWYDLQTNCTAFLSKFSKTQLSYLKEITMESTSGKVFVATDTVCTTHDYYPGLSYTNVAKYPQPWWTSGDDTDDYGMYMPASGDSVASALKSASCAFRPFICIDLTLLGQ